MCDETDCKAVFLLRSQGQEDRSVQFTILFYLHEYCSHSIGPSVYPHVPADAGKFIFPAFTNYNEKAWQRSGVSICFYISECKS